MRSTRKFFGNLMREARLHSKISLRDLAQTVGCSSSLLSGIENGYRSSPKDKKQIIRIAEALKIPVDDAVVAAKRDRERRDLSFFRKAFISDDRLAECYCSAREAFPDGELRILFREAFEHIVRSKIIKNSDIKPKWGDVNGITKGK